jgi:cytochrome c556
MTVKIIHIAMFVTAAVAIGGMLSAAPAAAPSAQAAIAARHAGFKKMGGAMKAINDQLKTDAPAKDVLIASAKVIAATARAQPKLFPAGSGPAAGVDTDALANIWTDRKTFDGLMVKMIAESDKLVTATAGGNIEAIRAQAKASGGSCAACHRQFRADT